MYGYNVDYHNFQIKRNGQHECTVLRKHAVSQKTTYNTEPLVTALCVIANKMAINE